MTPLAAPPGGGPPGAFPKGRRPNGPSTLIKNALTNYIYKGALSLKRFVAGALTRGLVSARR